MQHSSQQITQLLLSKNSNNKSSEELSHVVKELFHSPQSLIEKILSLNINQAKNRSKQFNIDAIFALYNNVKKHKLSHIIAKSYQSMISKFQQPQKLHQFVKSRHQMKLFFIMILWEQLFSVPENKLLLIRTLNLINSCPGYISIFEEWAKQLKQDYMTMIMLNLHQYLESQFEKLDPQTPLTEGILKALWLNISILAKFTGILYRSNLQLKRVPKQIFINPSLSKYFDPINQYKRSYKQTPEFNLTKFPYLMDLDYKHKLLQIQSILEQKINIQKSMSSGISSLINSMSANGGDFSLQGLIYLHFQINRNNILDESMEKLYKSKQNLKSPLRISFIGQEGSDQGGVKNQYFQLLTKQIFNPYLDMFLPKHNGRVYWFNGCSFEPPIRFQFVGMLLGLAIYNSVHLNIPFPNVLYKKLLNKSQQDEFNLQLLDDLFDIEPDIQKGLKKILEDQESSLEDLELYFTIQIQSAFGQKMVEELVEDGHQIKVTQDNKIEYCQLYADFLLNKHIKKQFESFKKGFYKVVSGKMIELLDPMDLKTIIFGNDVIDFKQLEETTSYQGYTAETPVIKNLWQVLHSLSIEDKKAFLIFTTGSDRVPIQGMKSLNFVIQKHANTSHLPSSHTCFNVFLLPEYENKQKLKKMIEVILKNNQGFGLI